MKVIRCSAESEIARVSSLSTAMEIGQMNLPSSVPTPPMCPRKSSSNVIVATPVLGEISIEQRQ